MRELEEQLLDILGEQLGCTRAHQGDDLARDDRGHVGVSVAVAPHPGRDADQARVSWDRRQPETCEGAIQPAVVLGHSLPARVFDDHHTVARLALRGRLGATDIRGTPRGELLRADLVLDVRDLARRERRALLILAEQLDDPLLLLEDRAPLRLGGMCREHELHILLEDGVADLGWRDPLGKQPVEAPLERGNAHDGGRSTVDYEAGVGAQVGLPAAHRLLQAGEVGVAHELSEELRRAEQRLWRHDLHLLDDRGEIFQARRRPHCLHV